MDNYQVLGVEKNASREEIKLVYENKVKDIERQVTNKKNADAFKKVLKDAYEGIISENSSLNESGQALEDTSVMSKEEIKYLLNSSENDNEEDYYDDYNSTEESRKKSKRKSSSTSSRNRKKKRTDNNENEKRREEEYSKNKRRKINEREEKHRKNREREEAGDSSILLIPLKILALPIIIVLSLIIFVLDLISLAVWIVSKVLMIASIAVGSVYGYQVYTGSVELRYDIVAACGGAFVIGICLPLITRIFRAPLKTINNSLKDFVF